MSLDATDTNLNLQFDNQTLTAPSTGLDHLTSSLNNKGEWTLSSVSKVEDSPRRRKLPHYRLHSYNSPG